MKFHMTVKGGKWATDNEGGGIFEMMVGGTYCQRTPCDKTFKTPESFYRAVLKYLKPIDVNTLSRNFNYGGR